MIVKSDIYLEDFEWWSGAISTAEVLTHDQFSDIEAILEAENPDGIDETELNDLFWHEPDAVAEMLGYDDFAALKAANEEEDEEE